MVGSGERESGPAEEVSSSSASLTSCSGVVTSINISGEKKKKKAKERLKPRLSYNEGRDNEEEDDEDADDALSLQEASVQTQKSDWWSIC